MPRRTRAALLCVALAAATCGCGSKGPLVLPPKEAKPAGEASNPAPPAAAPAPLDERDDEAVPASRGSSS